MTIDPKDKITGETAVDLEGGAAEISDEALNDVDGGYLTITMTNVQKAEVVGGAGVSPFAGGTTVDSGNGVIEYQDGDDLLLRKRPGRLKMTEVKM